VHSFCIFAIIASVLIRNFGMCRFQLSAIAVLSHCRLSSHALHGLNLATEQQVRDIEMFACMMHAPLIEHCFCA
jgi:hypothetical protein